MKMRNDTKMMVAGGLSLTGVVSVMLLQPSFLPLCILLSFNLLTAALYIYYGWKWVKYE